MPTSPLVKRRDVEPLVPASLDADRAAALVEVATAPDAAWVARAVVEVASSPTAVDSLLSAGWLEQWDGLSGGPHVVLSAFAMGVLDLRLDERFADETPVYALQGDPMPPVVVRHRRGDGGWLPFLDLVVDRRPGPLDELIAKEERAEKKRMPYVDPVAGEPLRLFQGPDGKGSGVPVFVDPRLAQLQKAQRRRRKGRTILDNPETARLVYDRAEKIGRRKI
jgi:hypothetical protein